MEPTQKKRPRIISKIIKFIANSAPFALLLSVILFGVEFYKNDKEFDATINGLKKIEQSLSTRHIGIFPDYLEEINKLLAETSRLSKDTIPIIIFEDVLFYGGFYNGNAFKEMIKQLTDLSRTRKVIIAYYDNLRNRKRYKDKMFREVVQESWIRDLSELAKERSDIADQNKDNSNRGLRNFFIADSIASEIYFTRYRDDKDNSQDGFLKRQEKILQFSFYNDKENDNPLFKQIDKIINACFNKPKNDITFNDIYTMYYQITEELKMFFYQHNIKTVPLDNYLTMSCWSNGGKVLFAFPGRFAADEIGFISHDKAILQYIDVMLKGIESNLKDENIER